MENSEATTPAQPEALPQSNTDLINKANNLIAKGKNELSMGLLDNSCASFASACEYYAKVYGDLGKECIYPYIYYANALLELGRAENGVVDGPTEEELKDKLKQKLCALHSSSLTGESNTVNDIKGDQCGNSVSHNKVEENLKSEGAEPGSDADGSSAPDALNDVAAPECADADAKNNNVQENDNECENDENGDKENENDENGDEENENDENGDEENENDENGDEENENDENGDEENENDEESNLRYADLILNLVTQICERNLTDDDIKLCLSDAYLKKAEVFEELDEFETALHYAGKALKVHESVDVPHFRMQAEIWCHMGMIHVNLGKYEDAANSYKSCLNILKKRIEEITSPTYNMGERSVEFEKSEIMELIDELNKRLVDIQMSVDENLKEMLKRAQDEGIKMGKIDTQNVTNITSKLKKRPLSPMDEVELTRKVPKTSTEEENSPQEKDKANDSKCSS